MSEQSREFKTTYIELDDCHIKGNDGIAWRVNHSACWLEEEELMVSTGGYGREGYLNNVTTINFKNGKMKEHTPKGDDIMERCGHNTFALHNHIFMVGGETMGSRLVTKVDVLEFANSKLRNVSKRFSFSGDLMPAKFRVGCTVVNQGKSNDDLTGALIYFFGGWSRQSRSHTRTIYKLEAISNRKFRWEQIGARPDENTGKFPSLRYKATLSNWREDSTGDHYLIMYAGYDHKKLKSDIWMFNCRRERWEQIKPDWKPAARYDHKTAVIGDRLVCVGGRTESKQTTARAHMFDLISRQWVDNLDMDERIPKRRQFAMAASKERIHVFGGFSGRTKVNDAFAIRVPIEQPSTWTEYNHHMFSKDFKEAVMTILLMHQFPEGEEDGYFTDEDEERIPSPQDKENSLDMFSSDKKGKGKLVEDEYFTRDLDQEFSIQKFGGIADLPMEVLKRIFGHLSGYYSTFYVTKAMEEIGEEGESSSSNLLSVDVDLDDDGQSSSNAPLSPSPPTDTEDNAWHPRETKTGMSWSLTFE